MNRLLLKVSILTALLVIAATLFGNMVTRFDVQAWRCNGSCSGGAGACIKKCNGKCCLWSSTGHFDCNVSLQGGEFECNSGPTAGCTCNNNKCAKGGGGICSNVGQVCSCSCNPVACPPGVPPNKFMTKPTTQGYGVSCGGGGCEGNSYACPPVHRNNAPTCSILPGSITMDRKDDPKQFQLSVTDQDYGDSVEAVSVVVKDTAGNINSCIRISSLAGGSLLGPVKTGSDNPGSTTQVTQFMVDARETHGIFANVGGRSVCAGTLEIEIRDLDSDAGGPDTSDVVKCSVAVEVTNNAPQVTSVKLFDRDTNSLLQESGNLINGTDAAVYVGSSVTTSTKARASFCKEALSLTEPIKCPGGGEEYFKSRHNPLLLEFTVSDANGSNDIMQAGAWLQLQTGANPESLPENNVVQFPPIYPYPNAVSRLSVQALYSEKESKEIGGKYYFISRGCLTSTCGPVNLATSSKQIFSGLGWIAAMTQAGNYAGDGVKVGNLINGSQQVATANEWHAKGYPDCLLAGGCSAANIPATAANVAPTGGAAVKANYAWGVGADDTKLLCYPSTGLVPKVVQASTPVVCPAYCAACMKREGVDAGSNPNEMVFKFGIYFNDSEASPVGTTSPQGMPAGKYSLFISALDKVGVPLNSVTGKTDEGWVRVNRSGGICTGATCAAGTSFVLHYDPIAPTITFNKWTYSAAQLDKITASATVVDNANGTGIEGVTNRFISRGETLDGEPLGENKWAKRLDGTDYDGSCTTPADCKLAFAGGELRLEGTGLQKDESIVAGACVYDKAGNMTCGRNSSQYIFMSAWLKTSYGDIFSSKGTNSPFAQTLPSNITFADINNTDNTRNVASPFEQQIFTGGTGFVMSGSQSGLGISGGYVDLTGNKQLGFKGNYRDGDTSSRYNLFGMVPLTIGNEFERARAAVTLNCDLMNEGDTDICQTNGTLATIGLAQYNIITVGSATVDAITCSKVNVIFVTGALVVRGDVVKQDKQSGCLFMLANGASLVVEDIPSNSRPADTDGKGMPHKDRFEAAIVANPTATISIRKAATKATNNSTDRFELTGWIYSAGTVPTFLRDLAAVDNRRYPAELLIYDATLLDVLRPFLGAEKTVDLVCGTSTHVLCATNK